MIQLLTTLKDFQHYRSSLNEEKSIGLVPTMGNLHAGHISLAEKALEENDVVIVTIFVNPKQFAPNEDLDLYPRTLEEDLSKLSTLARNYHQKKVVVFAPAKVEDVYSDDFQETIEVDHPMTTVLCGAFRDGHFSGVTTVVYRLFALTKPHKAYFGLKDYQQYKIIERMVQEHKLPVHLVPVEISRDQDGLALSSRNQYLSGEEREQALTLSQTLSRLTDLISQKPSLAFDYKKQVLSEDQSWQYLEILDARDLSPYTSATKTVLLAGAYILGKTRLIDNKTVEL